MITTFRIHPEIESYIRKQSEEENSLLEESLIAEGCRDPLVVWEEQNVLVDGHHRIAICRKHGLAYSVVYRSFPDIGAVKRWMRLNQLSRRNLDKDERERWIKELHAEGWTQAEIGEAVGITQSGVARALRRSNMTSHNEPTIKSTSAAEELEAKQREIERLRAEKEALAERERMEVQSRVKAEGELMSIRNQYEHLLESARKEQSKKTQYITPPDVEDELEALRLENSRIAAALEEEKRAQATVALPEPKVERVEVEVIKEVVPPAIQAKIREQENLIYELQRREVGNPKLEEKRDALLREIQQLREQANQARSEKGLIDGFDFLQTASSVTEKIVDMAGRGTLTIEQITEAERIFKGMLVAANNGIQAIRDIQGITKEGGGLRVVR